MNREDMQKLLANFKTEFSEDINDMKKNIERNLELVNKTTDTLHSEIT